MISLIIPCFNEQEILPQLYDRVSSAAKEWNDNYEVVLIDDGSTDQTWQLASELHCKDKNWKVIRFARNFGHQVAVSAGINYAAGDCVIVIDADLQDPPEELARFIEKWREGYEVVYAIRRKRKEHFLKKVCYKLFYRILGKLSDISIPYDSGDFCLMDRKIVDLLKAMPERNRFVRGLRSWVGFRQVGLEYERSARAAGEVKYTFRKLVNLAFDGIVSFSTMPLKIATYFGFVVSIIAILGALYNFFQRIFAAYFSQIGYDIVPGFATTIIAILFFGGVQLIFLGIIGEYLGRIYDEVKGRPLWTIQDKRGIE